MNIEDSEREIIQLIESTVCKEIGVKAECIKDKNKSMPISTARMMIWYILHDNCGISGGKIAYNYNRTVRAVWHSIADARYKIENCKFYSDLYDKIQEILAPEE